MWLYIVIYILLSIFFFIPLPSHFTKYTIPTFTTYSYLAAVPHLAFLSLLYPFHFLLFTILTLFFVHLQPFLTYLPIHTFPSFPFSPFSPFHFFRFPFFLASRSIRAQPLPILTQSLLYSQSFLLS